MKKSLIFTLVFLALFGVSLVSSCSFGQTQTIGQLTQYCDLSGNWINQKSADSSCLNDFECVDGYSCLSDQCVNSELAVGSLSELIEEVSQLNASCFNDGYFCFNGTAPINSTSSTKNCSYAGASASCYKCDIGFSWNATIGKCITGICNSAPGCLTNSSILNGTKGTDYCATGSCFRCNDDFVWNNSQCELKPCTYSPGCLDSATNNSLLVSLERNCSVGKTCFACKSGYVWSINESQCILSSGSVPASWSTLTFSDSEFRIGTTKAFGVYDRIYFTFESRQYWVGLISFLSNGVNVRIDPVIASRFLSPSVENKIDLNSDEIYDVKLVLQRIDGGKAYINVEKISESYGSTTNQNGGNGDTGGYDIPGGGSGNEVSNPAIVLFGEDATKVGGIPLGYVIIIFSIIILIFIILIIFFVVSSKKKQVVLSSVGQPTNFQQPVSDTEITNEIRRQLFLGNKYVADGKILPAKAVYSRISQLYSKLRVPNDNLYNDIVKFFNKLA